MVFGSIHVDNGLCPTSWMYGRDAKGMLRKASEVATIKFAFSNQAAIALLLSLKVKQ